MIRAMVVDDEPHARHKLARLLSAASDVELVGEYGTGTEALSEIVKLQPNLIFLDIQMPGLDGFQMLEALEPNRLPYVIFTTAYSKFASRAFEIEAIDYLLKPFDDARFQKAMARARRLLNTTSVDLREDNVQSLMRHLERTALRTERQQLAAYRLLVKEDTRIRFINASKIRHIQADGSHLRLAIDNEILVIRERMKDMENRLSGDCFIRIHRSTIVNLEYVNEMQAKQHGNYEFNMSDGVRYLSAAAYRDNIKLILSNLKTSK